MATIMTENMCHADKVRETAHSNNESAHSLIAASWRRSLLHHGLKPEAERRTECVSAAELAQARQQIDAILYIARQTIERLFRTIGDSGCCVLFTDSYGVIVERLGMPADDAIFKEWGLWTGAVWSESTEGTNGIGTCLAEKRPITIRRDQHFYSCNTAMSCMDAPIYDHEGNLIAALNISSCRRNHTDAFLSLIEDSVAQAARFIEAKNFKAAYPGARIILADNGPITSPGESSATLLAVDQDDLVVGATRAARKAYGLTETELSSPRPATDILSGKVNSADLDEAEKSEIRRALSRTGGNVSAAAAMLRLSRATLYRRMKRLQLI